MFVETVSRLNGTSENIHKKHNFLLPVEDLNISNIFYKIQNFNGWPVFFSVITPLTDTFLSPWALGNNG